MAGGQWRLPIPSVRGSIAVVDNRLVTVPLVPFMGPAGSGVPGIANLLGVDGPTLLTVWDLESIYIPAVAGAATGTPAGAVINTLLALTLNGQIVWQQQQQTIASIVAPAGFAENVGVETFADDFINPITVKRSDVLSLVAQQSIVGAAAATFSSLSVGMTLGMTAAGAPAWSAMNGAIGYQVIEIPGRRRL